MSWIETEGCWDAFAAELRDRWTKFSAADVNACRGDRDALIGKLQKLYGMTRDEARLQVADIESRARAGTHADERRYGTA